MARLSDTSRLQRPWNRTRSLPEDIRIQQDRVARAKYGQYFIPGYQGHIPDHNPPSATAFDPRPSEKERMLLYDLDQFSRELWPHYKGFKPQAPVNIKETKFSETPTTNTYYTQRTERALSFLKERCSKPKKDQQVKTGMKTFFTRGSSGLTSADGMAKSEMFYRYSRPYEGTLVTLAAQKALASRYI